MWGLKWGRANRKNLLAYLTTDFMPSDPQQGQSHGRAQKAVCFTQGPAVVLLKFLVFLLHWGPHMMEPVLPPPLSSSLGTGLHAQPKSDNKTVTDS